MTRGEKIYAILCIAAVVLGIMLVVMLIVAVKRPEVWLNQALLEGIC